MSSRTALAAAALLVFAMPAMAQEAPAAPPAAPAGLSAEAEAAIAEAEAAFEAKGRAFAAVMEAMFEEMDTAVSDADGDQAKTEADLNAIVARYQPQADAFAEELDAFLAAQLPAMPAEARAEMTRMSPVIRSQIIAAPATIKARLLQAAAAEAEADADPQ
jgi:hypothetical protein